MGTCLDVFEKEDKFVVKAELSGIKKEDIGVSVSLKKAPTAEKGKKVGK